MVWVWLSFFLAVTLEPFTVDGLIRRKVSQINFDYTNPMAHRYSLYIMLGVVVFAVDGLDSAVYDGCFIVAFAVQGVLGLVSGRTVRQYHPGQCRFPENRHRTVVGALDFPYGIGCDDRSDQGDQNGRVRNPFHNSLSAAKSSM
jgi:hypothetical protein